MRVPDITKLYRWPTADFAVVILSALMAFLVFSLMNKYMFPVPILPQIFGFIILTFVPGFIIFRILNIYEINRPLNIILIVGLSITFITFIGFVLNEIGLIFDYRTITFNHLFISIILLLSALCFLCIFLDKGSYGIEYIDVNLLQLNILVLVPTVAIMGSFLLNNFQSNKISIITILIISMLPFLYAYRKYHIPIIWSAAVSILLLSHLVSSHLWSWDIHYQFYYANLIMERNFWDPNLSSSSNSLISIILLAPIYSILLDLDLIWVYKIIYPILFSLVPIGIYIIVRDQSDDDIVAFFSSFIFIFYYGFFKDMVDKQFIAELFLILALTIMTIHNPKTKILAIAFVFMMIVSHYVVSYIVLFSLFIVLTIAFILRIHKDISIRFLGLAIIFFLGWFTYVSQAEVLEHIIYTFKDIEIGSLFTGDRSGVGYLYLSSPSLVWTAYKGINALILIFIYLGLTKFFMSSIKSPEIFKSRSLVFMAVPFSIFLFIQAFAAFNLGFDRALQIALVILSPFFVFGFMFIINSIDRLHSIHLRNNKYVFLSIFLCVLFLFDSGLIHERTGNSLPYSIALAEEHKYPDWNVYNSDEVNGVRWLKSHGKDYKISVLNPWSVLKNRDALLLMDFNSKDNLIILTEMQKNFEKSFLYLGGNNKDGGVNYNPFLPRVMTQSNKLYCSTNSDIYLISC
jgi:uncharacterized membrane protein